MPSPLQSLRLQVFREDVVFFPDPILARYCSVELDLPVLLRLLHELRLGRALGGLIYGSRKMLLVISAAPFVLVNLELLHPEHSFSSGINSPTPQLGQRYLFAVCGDMRPERLLVIGDGEIPRLRRWVPVCFSRVVEEVPKGHPWIEFNLEFFAALGGDFLEPVNQ